METNKEVLKQDNSQGEQKKKKVPWWKIVISVIGAIADIFGSKKP